MNFIIEVVVTDSFHCIHICIASKAIQPKSASMVTSWHGNAFCVTDPLCEGQMDFPKRGRFEELWCSIVVNLNKLLNKQSSWRCFETSWRSCDINIMWYESVWTSGTQKTPWVNYRMIAHPGMVLIKHRRSQIGVLAREKILNHMTYCDTLIWDCTYQCFPCDTNM